MAETSETKKKPDPIKFTVGVGTQESLDFSRPSGRASSSQYDDLVAVVVKMRPVAGQDILTLNPDAGSDAKQLRNRISAPIRAKAQAALKEHGCRVRIRVNKSNQVVLHCVPWTAEDEAAEAAAEAAAQAGK